MKRTCISFLKEWLDSPTRKPLVIRGARQVGKTYLVRQFAKDQQRTLFEVNLEKETQLALLLQSNNPDQMLLNLSAVFEQDIDPQNCILFFDEIQAAPELLAKLRWFAEDMPHLAIIAAGSLLEFALEDHTFSMPVGRIQYMHLEPLSFVEFLQAQNKKQLLEYFGSYRWDSEVPLVIHEKAMALFKEYLIVGGMPAAVSHWAQNRSLKAIHQIHHDLLATYRDDFSKYSGRIATQRLDETLMAVPRFLGQKLFYSRVNPSGQSIKHALDLLCKARLCHRVRSTVANGLPLGAELQERYSKVIHLDVGLCSKALGLSLDQLVMIHELNLINKGGIAEQVVGQLLRTRAPVYVEPSLYYWNRTEKGASAEVDYLIDHKTTIIPIEVKAGSTGTLKSLHLFMKLKQLGTAVRINSGPPQRTNIQIKDGDSTYDYTLLSLPFYLIGELTRLLD